MCHSRWLIQWRTDRLVAERSESSGREEVAPRASSRTVPPDVACGHKSEVSMYKYESQSVPTPERIHRSSKLLAHNLVRLYAKIRKGPPQCPDAPSVSLKGPFRLLALATSLSKYVEAQATTPVLLWSLPRGDYCLFHMVCSQPRSEEKRTTIACPRDSECDPPTTQGKWSLIEA